MLSVGSSGLLLKTLLSVHAVLVSAAMVESSAANGHEKGKKKIKIKKRRKKDERLFLCVGSATCGEEERVE